MPVEITERKFKQFIKVDKSTRERRLTKTKTYIAKYFGIHPKTLRNWMKKEGYGYLIGRFKGTPFNHQKRTENMPPTERDSHSIEYIVPEAEKIDPEKLKDSAHAESLPDDFDFELAE